MRHYLTLARLHSEEDLCERITKQNRFKVRLTNMVRMGGHTHPSSPHSVARVRVGLGRPRTDSRRAFLWGGLPFPEVRSLDPTSKAALQHYAKHQRTDSVEGLAELLLNICFVRNAMSKDLIQLVEMGAAPWLCLDPSGAVAEASKGAADETFLRLDGKVFFPFVEPMKSRSKAPRRFFCSPQAEYP